MSAPEPKADPGNWGFAGVKASALEKSGHSFLKEPKLNSTKWKDNAELFGIGNFGDSLLIFN
jgi:hypothetical protein